jgi:hypothetical protein
VWPDGVIYEGMLKNGLKHGRGVHTLADGSVYEGNFKKGLKDGKGVITYASDGQELNFLWSAGDKYDGEFHSDKRHGNCTYTFFNGDVLQCSWRDDVCPEFSQRQAALLNAAARATPEFRGMHSAAAGSVRQRQVRLLSSFMPGGAFAAHATMLIEAEYPHLRSQSHPLTPRVCAPGQSSARRRQFLLLHVIASGRRCCTLPTEQTGKTVARRRRI